MEENDEDASNLSFKEPKYNVGAIPDVGKDADEEDKDIEKQLLSAVHYACIRLSEDVVEEIKKETGEQMEFDGTVLVQTAKLVMDALCDTWPSELITFARHGKRSIVNINDLLLLFRKNETLVSFINALSTETARKRSKLAGKQEDPLKTRNKNNENKHLSTAVRQRKGRVSVDAKAAAMGPAKNGSSSIKVDHSKNHVLTEITEPIVLSRNTESSEKLLKNQKPCQSKETADVEFFPVKSKNYEKNSSFTAEPQKAFSLEKDDDFLDLDWPDSIESSTSFDNYNVVTGNDATDVGKTMTSSYEQEENKQAVTFEENSRKRKTLAVANERSSETYLISPSIKRQPLLKTASRFSDENSHDPFDGVDWDAIDQLESVQTTLDKSVLETEHRDQNAGKGCLTASPACVPGLKQSHAAIDRPSFSTPKQSVPVTVKSVTDSTTLKKKSRDCFTAFHFESDDEDDDSWLLNSSNRRNDKSFVKTAESNFEKSGDSANNGQFVKDQNVGDENSVDDCDLLNHSGSDIDMDATIFD